MNQTINEELERIKKADDNEKRKLIPIDQEAFNRYSNDIWAFFQADTRRKRAKKVFDEAREEYDEALAQQKKITGKIHQIIKEVNSDDNSNEDKN